MSQKGQALSPLEFARRILASQAGGKVPSNGRAVSCLDTQRVKAQLALRDGGYRLKSLNGRQVVVARCSICQEEFPLSALTIDHIFPKSRANRGEEKKSRRFGNLRLACEACNKKKSNLLNHL